MKKKVKIVLEFGVPPYRDFLFKYIDSISNEFLIIHNGENFKNKQYSYSTKIPKIFKISKFKLYLKIFKLLKESDVIIGSFNFWRPSCWLPMFFLNKKYILWGHIQGSYENIFSIAFKKICVRRADYILSYTENGKNYAVESLGAKKEKVLVVRNTLSVNNSSFSKVNRKYFLYVGRIQKRKGLESFIRQLSSIKFENELFRIVGDGDYKKTLFQLVEELNLQNRVSFYPGTFDEEELKSHFKYALAYVSPSQIGLGVVHSFSYGIPVLIDKSTIHGPEVEYCNDSNSFIYKGESQLRLLIYKILNNKSISLEKGESAFEYFNENLKIENMQIAFFQAIYK